LIVSDLVTLNAEKFSVTIEKNDLSTKQTRIQPQVCIFVLIRHTVVHMSSFFLNVRVKDSTIS